MSLMAIFFLITKALNFSAKLSAKSITSISTFSFNRGWPNASKNLWLIGFLFVGFLNLFLNEISNLIV